MFWEEELTAHRVEEPLAWSGTIFPSNEYFSASFLGVRERCPQRQQFRQKNLVSASPEPPNPMLTDERCREGASARALGPQ